VDRELLKQARLRLDGAQRILVSSHVRPDGDAVCSVLALGLALQDKGKHVQMVLADGVPAGFEHLAGVELIVRQAAAPVDLVVSVDAADPNRMGGSLSNFPQPDINIDHHVTNTRFGVINLIDPASVAACAMLAELFPELGLAFTPATVDALLTGILTDTIGLPTLNDILSELVKPGRDPRQQFETFRFAEGVEAIDDLKAGMTLPGVLAIVSGFRETHDTPTVLMDAIRLIEELVEKKADIVYAPRHPADVQATWADISKAERLLGWRPQSTFRAGAEAMVRWYQAHRVWAMRVTTS